MYHTLYIFQVMAAPIMRPAQKRELAGAPSLLLLPSRVLLQVGTFLNLSELLTAARICKANHGLIPIMGCVDRATIFSR